MAMVSVVCLSVTFVHPTQTVKLFGNILLLLSSYLHEYPCFTCFTMANHYCINRHYTASISSLLHLTISAGETLVRIIARTHPWLVCRIMGAIV